MRSRSWEGVREGEARTFGPQAPAGTRWLLLRLEPSGKAYEQHTVEAPTAFLACAKLGWGLGELLLAPRKV